jgi:hypothetical protein
VNLHLRLSVFFDDPSQANYQLSLNHLHDAAKNFLVMAKGCGIDLKYAPNYILQMMLAAAVALLKLLNSFFKQYVDPSAGEEIFWDTITEIRKMSVKTNDLPQRFAEVFAQMWNADAERESTGVLEGDGHSLSLKRRYRMSMSHVFDYVWRWKDEFSGQVRPEKLDLAIKNPTSPQALTHRSSFSNGRRPSDLVSDSATAALNVLGGFDATGFGTMPALGGADNLATEYQLFDPMGWYLDGYWGPLPGGVGSEAFQ